MATDTALPTTRMRAWLIGLSTLAVFGTLVLAASVVRAQEAVPDASAVSSQAMSWAFIAAALATAASALGAGIAVARVGTAAVGALAEKPELFGRLLIFVGLAEGIAIYGLIVSILILNRVA